MTDISSRKLNWFGSLPPGWQSRKIKFACQLRVQQSSNVDSYLGLEDLVSYGGLSDQWDPDKAKLSTGNGNLALPGDVVFSKLRVYLAKGLVVCRPLRCTTELIILNPVGVIAEYLNWILKSEAFISYLDTASYGTKMPRISPKFLLESAIPIPPVDEQQKISSLIGCKVSEISGLIEKLQREVELLERYRRELIAHTVTHGLDPDVPMRDSGIDWIGKIPSHWKTASISTITDENKIKNSDLSEKNLLSLSYGKIIRKDIDLAFGLLPASFDAYQVLENGYIVLRMTDLQNDKRSLRSAISKEKGIITGAYIGLKTRSSISPDYLAWLLRFYDLAKVFYSLGGGVRQSANYKEIGKIAALVPPLDEQEEIAIFLNKKSTEVDLTISSINKQIELLDKYRKQVINYVVTGKVRVEGAE